MASSRNPWVQSLLLVSPKRSPQLTAQQKELSPTEIVQERKPDTTQNHIDLQTDVLDRSLLSAKSFSAELRSSKSISIADLCQDQPFWPSQFSPATNQRIEVLGNGVVVSVLPIQVSFLLYAVICGHEEDLEYSWEITGPHQKVPLQTVQASAPKKLTLHPLNVFHSLSEPDDLGWKTRTILETVSLTVEQSGLYIIALKLNGDEGSRLPLVVRHWMPEENKP
jgi:hypothetical protein